MWHKPAKANAFGLTGPQIMKWLLKSVTIFLILATIFGLAALSYARFHKNRFFYGVTINGERISDLSYEQALNLWQNRVDNFIKQGLNYQFNGQIINLPPTLPSTDPDLAYELASWQVPQTVNRAYNVGRLKGYRRNFIEQLLALIFKKDIPLELKLNEAQLLAALKNNFDHLTRPKQEARPLVDDQLNIVILPEVTGTAFNYQDILQQSFNRLKNLSSEPIKVALTVDQPTLKKEEITAIAINQLQDRLGTSSLSLIAEGKKWAIPVKTFKDWLAFAKKEGQVTLTLNREIVLSYLEKEIAPQIFKPTLDAKFEINNGRVEEFQGSQDGVELDLNKTLDNLERQLITELLGQSEMVVKKTKAKVATNSVNDLGIREIIGTGKSNFKGSPKNRRYNINLGAKTLNGILIKPGETFSLIAALGKIEAKTGYLPELVIKGDKTTPEYGGGLCQIGTTAFRAALKSGLPIKERRNHSYRVVYYEPAGLDATIYDPSPDLKFLNDTANHILIQTRIEGDDLYFDFWGSPDEREIKITPPVIYNIKPAGPVVNIETEELKPGEKKCTETAHNGADAYFDYQVNYPDGRHEQERFSSHYIPWPAKCLVGKEPTPIDGNNATSTLEVVR